MENENGKAHFFVFVFDCDLPSMIQIFTEQICTINVFFFPFSAITRTYYRRAEGALLVYSIDR